MDKFFIWTVTIEPFVSEGDFNKPVYGTAKCFKAKIERQQRTTREDTQQTTRSRRLIYLLTDDTSISVKDRLTLPAQFEPTQPKINDVRIVHDHVGVHHIVLET